MKRCPKCNLTYSDDVKFCSECGEKLIEEKVCPKCGAPISENDKFCKACGEKLVKEEVVNNKEDKSNELTAKQEEQVDSSQRKEKAKIVINIIVSAICLFVLTFITVGVFGDIFKLNSSLGNSEIGLRYFFETYPNTLTNLHNYGGNSMYYVYCLAMYIIECVLYFGGMVACIVLSILAVIKNIKAIVNKSEPNTKLVFAAASSMLPIMLFFAARMKVEYTYLSTSFGWGASMIISGLVFTFIAISALKISKAFIERKNVASAFILTGAAMFLLIYVFNAFAPLTTVRDSSERVSLNGIDFLENILSSHVATNTAFSNSELGVIITGGSSFLLSLAGITLLFFAFRSTLKDKKITSIILTSVAYLVLIITAVLSLVAAMLAYSNDTYVYSFASGVITALVFLQFVIAGLIVSAAISKKKAE